MVGELGDSERVSDFRLGFCGDVVMVLMSNFSGFIVENRSLVRNGAPCVTAVFVRDGGFKLIFFWLLVLCVFFVPYWILPPCRIHLSFCLRRGFIKMFSPKCE